MAKFKCRGFRKLDDDGKPFCTFEAERSWHGRCPGCGRLYGQDKVGADVKPRKELGSAAAALTDEAIVDYIPTGISNFDEVVGGGLVKGQLLLFGGPQGSGKSRLALQICQTMAERIEQPFLFASAEEVESDVYKMCRSIGVTSDRIKIIGSDDFDLDSVLHTCKELKPALFVLDSLQAADGWGTQNTETAIVLKEYCDKTGQIVIAMNHMAKDLSFKGGTTVAHMFKSMIMLYEYDPGQDGKVRETFGAKFANQAKNGEVKLVDIRTLMSGKNRSGGTGRKAFFIFDNAGKLIPLQKKSPVVAADDPEDEDDEEEKKPRRVLFSGS
jgi:predicted ATP-dependent serine protease